MPVILRSAVGDVTFDRLVRDRVVTPLVPGAALPRDLPSTPSLRARALSPHIPPHTVVSALAGLWVHCDGAGPRLADVVGERGLHRVTSHRSTKASSASLPLRYHSGAAAREAPVHHGSLRVASVARCCIDSLRWSDLSLAYPAVMAAIQAHAVSGAELAAAFSRDDPRGAGYARLASAWQALIPAVSDSPDRHC